MTRREISRDRLVRQAGILKVPILVLAGEDDRIVDPESADVWTRTVPSEAVLLDACGHLPMLERPEELDARLLAFLTGDPRYLEGDAPGSPEASGEDLTTPLPPEEPPVEPPLAFRPKSGAYLPDPSEPREGRPDPGVPDEPTEAADESAQSSREEEARPDRPGEGMSSSVEPDVAGQEPANVEDAGGREDVREMPEGLFQWPESLNEPKPWERPHDDEDDTLDLRDEEGVGEDASSEGDPRRGSDAEGPGPENDPDR